MDVSYQWEVLYSTKTQILGEVESSISVVCTMLGGERKQVQSWGMVVPVSSKHCSNSSNYNGLLLKPKSYSC